VELELRRFSVTLKRLTFVGGVDFDLLSSIVPCLPLNTEYCILDFRGWASAGRWRLVTLLSLFVH
jgi:hypothetical protein